MEPANEWNLISWNTKKVAAIKVNESKKSEAIAHVIGIKKKDRTIKSLISPAPILAHKIKGAESNTAREVSG
jgi:hypothetical protein